MTHLSEIATSGAAKLPDADFWIEYRLGGHDGCAVAGLRRRELADLAKVGRGILSAGYEGYPETTLERLLLELAARVRNTISGDAAALSLLALSALASEELDMPKPAAGEAFAVRMTIDAGEEPRQTIERLPAMQAAALAGSVTPERHVLVPPTKRSPRDLNVIVGPAAGWTQSIVVPHRKVKTLLRAADADLSHVPTDVRTSFATTVVIEALDGYRKSLLGELSDAPASRWIWPSAELHLAGLVCWVLRKGQLLDVALANADILAFRITPPLEREAEISFGFELEPTA